MRGALADVSKQEPDPEDVWTEQGIGTFFSRVGASKLFFFTFGKILERKWFPVCGFHTSVSTSYSALPVWCANHPRLCGQCLSGTLPTADRAEAGGVWPMGPARTNPLKPHPLSLLNKTYQQADTPLNLSIV